ncbi:MAG: KAP family NTPase [Deltaproteobacteria bacterium]|jgi:hypothetical protein|nr:KAP family NTPase [Deltaproteobacteria bacterium]
MDNSKDNEKKDSRALRDAPVVSLRDESLGLSPYAKALADFARACETPLTIALQGDWGSGKTSLMYLIEEELLNPAEDEESAGRYATIWFNTWQYSQFGFQKELPLSLLNHFFRSLGAPKEAVSVLHSFTNLVRRVAYSLKKVTEAASSSVPGVGVVNLMSNVALEATKDDDGYFDFAKCVVDLKNQILSVVEKKVKEDGLLKIVVFVDDLDRLPPVVAVDLLEIFKIFLDVDRCVFILACDYQIINDGLKAKFGSGSVYLKSKSFFDKIIQLPFQMPVARYDLSGHLKKMLENAKMKAGEEEASLYAGLIENSIGLNPRNLKRVFNCLLLLKIVRRREDPFENSAVKDPGVDALDKILFATVCFQRSYEPLFTYVLKNIKAADDDFFFKKTLLNEKSYEKTGVLHEIFRTLKSADPSLKAGKLTKFLRLFFSALQTDEDEDNLSESEAKLVELIFSFSAVTNDAKTIQAEGVEEKGGSGFQRALADILLSAFNSEFQKISSLADEGGSFQAKPEDDGCHILLREKSRRMWGDEIGLWFDRDVFQLYLKNTPAKNLESVQEQFDRHLRAGLGSLLLNKFEDPYLVVVQGNVRDSSKHPAKEQAGEIMKNAEAFFDAFLKIRI